MRYGIRWYAGVGEHDYEEHSTAEYATLAELLNGLLNPPTDGVWEWALYCTHFEDLVFDALDFGRQDSVYWVTDDFGFELYRPTAP